jgi:hypothetical protein
MRIRSLLWVCIVTLLSGCGFIPPSWIAPETGKGREFAVMKPLGQKAALMPPEILGPIRRRIAVIIGISKYSHSSGGALANLRYASADADAFAVHLMNSGFDTVRVLTDKKACLDDIQRTIRQAVAEADKDDFLLISWAGHCLPDPLDPDALYLAAHDTDATRLATPGYAYAMVDFKRDLIVGKAKRLMVILDTCQSGAIAGKRTVAVSMRPPPDILHAMRGVYIENVPRKPDDSGLQVARPLPDDWGGSGALQMRLVFATSQQGEPSVESSKLEHGVFSYYLLKGLQGDADVAEHGGNEDGVVTVDEVILYVGTMVRKYTRNHQNPAIGGIYDGTIPMGIVRK